MSRADTTRGDGAGDPPVKTEPPYKIGDLAAELHITTRAIRFYETKGLIAPRRVGGARTYSQRDRARLLLILRGKRLGFTLGEIGEYLDLYEADPNHARQIQHLLDKVDKSIDDLNQKRTDIEHTLRELKDVRDKCIRALEKRS